MLNKIPVPRLFVVGLLFTITNQVASADEIKIGVRAHRGADVALNRWQATVDYLSQKIPEHTFVLIPYEINSLLNEDASRKAFDFVLTNPAAHVEQKIRYGVTPIATLINKRKGKGYTQFGTVIFTRSDRNDINGFQDLVGKSFMGADEQGFGGWRVAWHELLNNGIDPYKDFKLLSFGGGIQQNVVYAVRDGQVDAGSVRTDMLERMEQRGEINLENFKILGAKTTEGFEFRHSTPLYPEWPFAKLKHTSQELSKRVASALYNIPETSNAAIKGKYIGWILPQDYTPVDNLLKDLRVGPYTPVSPESWREVVTKHWVLFLSILILVTTGFIIIVYMIRSNKRLKEMHTSLQTEVSERRKTEKELASSQQILQLVLDTIPVRVFWKDRDSVYLGCNKLFAKDAGLDQPDELIGKTDYDMGWAEQANLYRADDKVVMESKSPKLNYEEPQTTPSGDTIWLETSKIPLTDVEGKVIGMLGAYNDITERKLNQRQLDEYRTQLEEKVAERTAALETSNKELESYSYSIAHDLRAPLRSLIGFSQIIAEDAADRLNEEELDALARIVAAGNHMADLIDDILELSKITRSKLNVAPVDISEISREIIDNFKDDTQKRNIQWKIQDKMIDTGDEILIRLLMQNLIDNACKFTNKTSDPTIDISRTKNGKGYFYHIHDNGIGFEMEYADKIFLPFHRLHSEEFDGTGVGLATVQRIVQRHGGEIWAEGKPGQGATFHFTLNPSIET